jgi:hypothetical protein
VDAVTLTPKALREAAEAKSGFSDYSSDSYMAALEPLLYSIEHEAKLNANGRQEMRDRIVNALANRLTVVAWEKDNPDLAAAPIVAPIFILGLPRTGSSILHETLAAAPGMRTPLIWELRDYSLVHQVTDAGSDSRIEEVNAAIARKNQLAPGYAAIHFEEAQIPMECLGLLVLDLVTTQFATIAYAPTYREFLIAHDARVTYQWHRRGLRYLQASSPGARWVLKAPMHSLYLGALLETYPDARIIQTHRNPVQSLGSLCSLYEVLRRAWSDDVPILEHSPGDVAYSAEVIQRTVHYRRDHASDEGRYCDVAFKRFMGEPAEALERIFAHCGQPFTNEARSAMLGYLENRPRDKYGKHTYTLEQFGLSQAGLEPMFADYTARFAEYL